MIRVVFLSVAFLYSGLVLAQQPETPEQWLEKMREAVRNTNFETSFVLVQENKAEPYRWIHGLVDGVEHEQLSLLNGPGRAVVRRADVVSFFESDVPPYSLNSNYIFGPVPPVYRIDYERLQESYRFILVGRSRIAGRPAQMIRIVPKDNHRYGIWLWLDKETGLILKVALMSRSGELLEQMQFTDLKVTEEPSELMVRLSQAELPSVLDVSQLKNTPEQNNWKVGWMPVGMKLVKSDRHRLATTRQEVDYMMISDGLVNISVYVQQSPAGDNNDKLVRTGGTTMLSLHNQGYEVTVVGKIPANTAEDLARSIYRAQ